MPRLTPTTTTQFFRQWMHRAKHAWWPALVVASLVHAAPWLVAHFEGFISGIAEQQALDYPTPDGLDARSRLALAVIDEKSFETLYAGRSPISRCRLVEELRPILANKSIQTLGLDYAIERTSWHKTNPFDCQEELEGLLNAHANKVIVVSERASIDEMPKVRTASPSFDKAFGFVHRHRVADPQTLGSRMALEICRLIEVKEAAPPYCGDVEPGGLRFLDDAKASHARAAVSFRYLKHLYQEGAPLRLNDPCLSEPDHPCKVRHVLIGGRYGSEDKHATAVGERYGVDIHAAIASAPRVYRSTRQGLVLDALLGAVFFGPLASWVWQGYFLQKLGRSRSRSVWLRAAPLAHVRLMLGGGLLLLMLAAGFLLIVSPLFLLTNIWISPVPIAVGMAVESMVVGSVHSAEHLLSHGSVPAADVRAHEGPDPPQKFVEVLPTVVGMALVAYAFIH